MSVIHYIGFDVHKNVIAYCVETADGKMSPRSGDENPSRGLRPFSADTPGNRSLA
jgi:hypothetical protein